MIQQGGADRMRTRKGRSLLRTFGELWLEFDQQAEERLKSLTDVELLDLTGACHAASEWNIAWYDYRAAKHLLRAIPIERQRRSIEEKKAVPSR